MPFQIKDFVSIVAGMVNYVRATSPRLTDFTVGSVTRTMHEAVAIEMDSLYQQMVAGLREAIPVATYRSFDFNALPAQAASGIVRVTITAAAANITIPLGATFLRSDGVVTYTVTAAVTITAGGTTADVPVAATVAGVAGNLGAADTWTMGAPPAGFVSASNVAAFTTGRELETDDEQKLRFNAFILSLARSTVAALTYGAKQAMLTDANGLVTERVIGVAIVEPDLTDPDVSDREVKVYVHNGTGSTSADLITRTQAVLDGYTDSAGVKVAGYKAAGVPLTVYGASETTVAVTGVVTVAAGADGAALANEVEALAAAYILSLEVGGDFIRAEVIAAAMALEGVTNVTLSVPSGDTAAAATVKLMPGTITMTVA